MTTSDNIAQLETVQQFVQCAESYCALVEGHEAFSAYAFVKQAAGLLPMLYRAGMNLPDIRPPELETDKPDAFYDTVSQKRTGALSKEIGAKFGEYNFYTDVTDPFLMSGDDTRSGKTLGEDFADMYGDLKRGLIAVETGEQRAIQQAVWHWKSSLMTHWGKHLVDLLRALHYLLADYLITE